MLTCKQASQLISQSLDHPLSLSNRIQLRFHLLICDACNRFRKQLKRLSIAMRHMRKATENDNTITLSTKAKVRIIDSVASKHL
jgi:hypothetical protein